MRKKKWLERGKSILIALLALMLVVLTILALPAKTVTDTPWLAAIVRPFASVMGLTQGELTYTPMADAGSVTGAAQPTAISVQNPAGRTSYQYSLSALDSAFEQFGAALGQALETAQEPERTSALRVQQALSNTSVAFYYPGETLAALAASWLHVDTALTERAQWFILSVEKSGVRLYLVGSEQFSCQTQVSGESLEQLLQNCTPDGSFFAFEDAQHRFSALAPLSLLPGQTPELHAAEASNPCDARFSDALASTLGFNPYGDARYTDDAGNTTYTETGYTLSISASGELLLRSEGQVTRFSAASQTPSELVECARSLLATMTSGILADARLYVTSFEQDGAQSVCTFDYCLGGIPVLPAGGHAAEIRFSGASIVQVRLLLRSYTLTTQTLSVLPPAQAAAILPEGSDLQLIYSDDANGVSAGWQS